ncbi:ATP-dependent zinc protease [Pseudomonas syringae]|nr:ATP-dependent zinc protease [Pseudomonas syringae]
MRSDTFAVLCCGLLMSNLCISADKTVYGLHEHARLTDIDLDVRAKLDTGAAIASLSARNIKYFTRNGEQWVSFSPAIQGSPARIIEKPLVRVDQIKRRADDRALNDQNLYTDRPVIILSVCMGDVLRTIEVNLTDRSDFEYPFLIGANALRRFDALVDPSLKYKAGKPGCASVAQNAE